MLPLTLYNVFWSTPTRRRFSLGALASIAPFVGYLGFGLTWQQASVALAPTVFAEVFLFRFALRWRAIRPQFMRKEMRWIRSLRLYALPNPIVDALQYLSFGLVFLSIAFIAAGWQSASIPAMGVAVVVLAAAGLCETVVRISRVAKSMWAPMIGKILSVSVCVILAAISLSMAKQATHALVQIDPKYLTEFVSVVTFIFIPIVYLSTAAVVLLLYAVLQFLVLFALAIGDMIFGQTQIFLGSGPKERLRLYFYRIVHGRKPLGGKVPKAGFLPKAHISLLASPLSKLAFVMVLSPLLSNPVGAHSAIKPALETALLALEYRDSSRCLKFEASSLVAYMEDGWVSVAHKENGTYIFEVRKCNFSESD